MQYKKFENKILLRTDIGEDISEQILKIADKEKITLASVSGIGAVNDFTIGIFNLEKGEYETSQFKGSYEITSLNGNISTMDKKPYVHLHINCAGKDGKTVGGHLLKSQVSITGEIFIDIINGEIERKHQEKPNFNRMEV
ncbi:MAG: DNA-binding protein [Clostridia bacterium]|nr:DNA-binding protein [Clostridia bacterium]